MAFFARNRHFEARSKEAVDELIPLVRRHPNAPRLTIELVMLAEKIVVEPKLVARLIHRSDRELFVACKLLS